MEESRPIKNDSSNELLFANKSGELAPPRFPYADTIEVEPQEGSESHELLEYWQIIRRRKGTFVLIAFIGALGGMLITLPQTPMYQARAAIEITVPSNALNFRDAAPDAYEYQDAYLQTQVRILQSESLRSRVAAKLQARDRPESVIR